MNEKIKNLVINETEKVKKKRPFLEKIDISYEQNNRGTFLSKLKAVTNNKTIFIKQESRCPESAVRKVFTNLTKLLKKRKYKRSNKLDFDFTNVA